MSGGVATLLQPPSPLSVPCRTGCQEREPLTPEYIEPEGSSVEDTIFAPTPLVRISAGLRFQDPEPGTPKALSGIEIESILAEKGMTGENIICPFPKIQSSEDFTRLVTHGDMPSSPLLGMGRCTSMPGLDDMPLGFPMRNRSLLDLSAMEYETASQYEEEEESSFGEEGSMAEPPLRSLNPLKNLLYKRKVVIVTEDEPGLKVVLPPKVKSVDPKPEEKTEKKRGNPFGAELGLDKLSPPINASDY